MKQSLFFTKIKKEAPKDAVVAGHKYLVRGDFIEQTISGVYRLLPLGFKVFKKIENVIREEMLALGALELYLPALQNKSLWMETGRWEKIDPPLFKFKDRHKKEIALGSTHEEEITDTVRKRVDSYQDLPFSLFQIQDKFRNETRPSGGLLRTREFIMKDLYSFHASSEDLANFYEKVRKSYFQIFKRCGLETLCVEASSGTIGGDLSHEFMVLDSAGEDRILVCGKCGFAGNVEKIGEKKKCPKCQGLLQEKRSIEAGHIFALGTKYSRAMKAEFTDEKGLKKPIEMGCYGIGLPRIMATVAQVCHDQKGIRWPEEIAPFQIHLIALGRGEKVFETAEKIYRDLQKRGKEVLYDDRKQKSAGEKFAEADLIGAPLRMVLSEKTLQKKSVELKKRSEDEIKLVKISEIKC